MRSSQHDQDGDGELERNLKPKFLHGELEVTRASRVVLYPPVTNKEDAGAGKEGLLVVTNFKLSFITVEDSQVMPFCLGDSRRDKVYFNC